jgi:hypothetical protein
MMEDSIWREHKLEGNESLDFICGAKRIHLHRLADDWILRTSDANSAVDATLKESDGQRWAFPSEASGLKLSPCMPDRSLVVRPTQPLNIPPATTIQFYFDIPVWVKIEAGMPKNLIEIARIESHVLSNTWFGDPTAGLFCYANRDFISREYVLENRTIENALCPFKISNTSKHALNVDRICVHVKFLSLYETVSGLWSNEVTANFRGEGKETIVSHSRTTPKEAGKPLKIFPSNEKPEKHYTLQTFLHQGIFRKKPKEDK